MDSEKGVGVTYSIKAIVQKYVLIEPLSTLYIAGLWIKSNPSIQSGSVVECWRSFSPSLKRNRFSAHSNLLSNAFLDLFQGAYFPTTTEMTVQNRSRRYLVSTHTWRRRDLWWRVVHRTWRVLSLNGQNICSTTQSSLSRRCTCRQKSARTTMWRWRRTSSRRILFPTRL